MKYDELVVSAPVVLVEFFATWCPHCQKMMPVVADVKKRVEGKAAVVQLDIDQNQELASENDVQGVPTFLLYSNGVLVWRESGEMDETTILEAIDEALAN